MKKQKVNKELLDAAHRIIADQNREIARLYAEFQASREKSLGALVKRLGANTNDPS